MNNLHKKTKTIIASIFVVFLIASGLLVAPRPTHAFLGVVFDPTSAAKEAFNTVINKIGNQLTNALTVKEYGLDGVAWLVAKRNLKKISNQIINGVSKGYKNPDGSTGPGFITDLKERALTIGDSAASTSIKFIQKNTHLNLSKYESSLAKSIGKNVQNEYSKSTSQNGFWSTHKETLSKTATDTPNFLSGKFSAGGWDGWNAIDSNVNNNPYYINKSAKDSTTKKVAVAKKEDTTKLNWGQGVLSNKNTPGSVIKSQLDKSLSTGMSSLVSADELDEMIGALAQGLVSKALGNGGGPGLVGIAKAATGGGVSILKKYLDEPSPPAVVSNIKLSMKEQIAQKNKSVKAYLVDEQKILDASHKATLSLQQLTTYSISYQDFYGKQYTCSASSQTIAAANNAIQNIKQNVYSPTQKSILNTNVGYAKLQKINTQLTSSTGANFDQITNDFQKLVGYGGGLPTIEQMSVAQSESSLSSYDTPTNGNAKVSSSGVGKLTVAGGTTIDRMVLLKKNAVQDLQQAQQTCNLQKQQAQSPDNL